MRWEMQTSSEITHVKIISLENELSSPSCGICAKKKNNNKTILIYTSYMG